MFKSLYNVSRIVRHLVLAVMPDEPGWTRVISRKFRASKHKLHSRAPPPHVPDTSVASTRPSLSEATPAELKRRYLARRAAFELTPSCAVLRAIVADNARACPAPITVAICLGTGSFDPPDGSCDFSRRAFLQLAAFLVMVDSLSEHYNNPIKCIFQEPQFSPADAAFLADLAPTRHHVVTSPEAFRHVSPEALVFGIHLYHGVISEALADCLPAVFVGTPLHVWENNRPTHLVPKRLRELDAASVGRREFPCEPGDYCFSGTSIYWTRGLVSGLDPRLAVQASSC